MMTKEKAKVLAFSRRLLLMFCKGEISCAQSKFIFPHILSLPDINIFPTFRRGGIESAGSGSRGLAVPINPFQSLAAASALLAAPTKSLVPIKEVDDKALKVAEYKKKMKKLNKSLLNWMDRQIEQNSLAIWKEAMQVSCC